jgi:hypothetical protein
VKHDDAVAGETVEAAAARARKLARQKGRSGWPEFAVKVWVISLVCVLLCGFVLLLLLPLVLIEEGDSYVSTDLFIFQALFFN